MVACSRNDSFIYVPPPIVFIHCISNLIPFTAFSFLLEHKPQIITIL